MGDYAQGPIGAVALAQTFLPQWKPQKEQPARQCRAGCTGTSWNPSAAHDQAAALQWPRRGLVVARKVLAATATGFIGFAKATAIATAFTATAVAAFGKATLAASTFAIAARLAKVAATFLAWGKVAVAEITLATVAVAKVAASAGRAITGGKFTAWCAIALSEVARRARAVKALAFAAKTGAIVALAKGRTVAKTALAAIAFAIATATKATATTAKTTTTARFAEAVAATATAKATAATTTATVALATAGEALLRFQTIDGFGLEGLAGEFFDVEHATAVAELGKRHGHAFTTGAARTANAVRVVLGLHG